MIRASYIKYLLRFHQPAGTSRGILHQKDSWYLFLKENGRIRGIGEVSYIPGLSRSTAEEIEEEMKLFCRQFNGDEVYGDTGPNPLKKDGFLSAGENQDVPGNANPGNEGSFSLDPGLVFAIETALRGLEQEDPFRLYHSGFTEGNRGIPINGLIWMGDRDFMLEQVRLKIEDGFRVLKLKVGAIRFEEELNIIRAIRSEYSASDLELRLDANGAWSPGEAGEKMAILAALDIHSIEQPIPAGLHGEMAGLCENPVIPIALDEDLVAAPDPVTGREILGQIMPDYIIIKPGMLGGATKSEEWISAASDLDIGWWITSALESDIGLNAIAQWTASLNVDTAQGLGTGKLYSNNVHSPLNLKSDSLWYDPGRQWDLSVID